MELRKRKWIYNQLPKYDNGKPVGVMDDDGTTQDQINLKNSMYRDFPGPPDPFANLNNIPAWEILYNKQKKQLDDQIEKANKYNSVLNIAQNGINFLGSSMNANTLGRGTGEIIADAGKRNVYNGEFSWQKYNDINAGQEMSDLHKQHVSNTLNAMGSGAAFGASIGSVFPGAGTAIGAGIGAAVGGIVGLVGGGITHAQMRKRIYNAQQFNKNNNNYNFASAQGNWMRNQYNLNHNYTQNGQIFSV